MSETQPPTPLDGPVGNATPNPSGWSCRNRHTQPLWMVLSETPQPCVFQWFWVSIFLLPMGFGGLKIAPRGPKYGLHGPNIAPRLRQDGPKMALRWLKMEPKGCISESFRQDHSEGLWGGERAQRAERLDRLLHGHVQLGLRLAQLLRVLRQDHPPDAMVHDGVHLRIGEKKRLSACLSVLLCSKTARRESVSRKRGLIWARHVVGGVGAGAESYAENENAWVPSLGYAENENAWVMLKTKMSAAPLGSILGAMCSTLCASAIWGGGTMGRRRGTAVLIEWESRRSGYIGFCRVEWPPRRQNKNLGFCEG